MTFPRLFLLLFVLGLGVAAWGYRSATLPPEVRRAEVRLAGMPSGEPLKVVLISDVHVAGPDMPPERLAGIVADINKLAPD